MLKRHHYHNYHHAVHTSILQQNKNKFKFKTTLKLLILPVRKIQCICLRIIELNCNFRFYKLLLKTVFFTECPKITPTKVELTEIKNEAITNSTGVFTCPSNFDLFDIEKGQPHSNKSICLKNGTWKYQDRVECWTGISFHLLY